MKTFSVFALFLIFDLALSDVCKLDKCFATDGKSCEENEKNKRACIKSVFKDEDICDCQLDMLKWAKFISYGTDEQINQFCTLGYVRALDCEGMTDEQHTCVKRFIDGGESLWENVTISEMFQLNKDFQNCFGGIEKKETCMLGTQKLGEWFINLAVTGNKAAELSCPVYQIIPSCGIDQWPTEEYYKTHPIGLLIADIEDKIWCVRKRALVYTMCSSALDDTFWYSLKNYMKIQLRNREWFEMDVNSSMGKCLVI